MVDNFTHHMASQTQPATKHTLGVPGDGIDLDPRPRVLRILTAGNLAVRDERDVVIIYPVTAGEEFNFRAVGVQSTGTTATFACWE